MAAVVIEGNWLQSSGYYGLGSTLWSDGLYQIRCMVWVMMLSPEAHQNSGRNQSPLLTCVQKELWLTDDVPWLHICATLEGFTVSSEGFICLISNGVQMALFMLQLFSTSSWIIRLLHEAVVTLIVQGLFLVRRAVASLYQQLSVGSTEADAYFPCKIDEFLDDKFGCPISNVLIE